MGVKSVSGRLKSIFDLADIVMIPSGRTGEIIAIAEFWSGWEYRIRPVGKTRTMYRKESQLRLVKRGTKTRRAELLKAGKKE